MASLEAQQDENGLSSTRFAPEPESALQIEIMRGHGTMNEFDWHSGEITRATPVTPGYRNTQKVRRFLRSECGAAFKFDVPFIAWIKDGRAKTMGDVADEWLRRRRG